MRLQIDFIDVETWELQSPRCLFHRQSSLVHLHATLEQPNSERPIKPTPAPLTVLHLRHLRRLRRQELLFLPINDILPRIKVRLMWPDPTGLEPGLVTKDQRQIHWDTDVSGNEILVVKVTIVSLRENGEVLRECDEDGESKGAVGAVDAEGSDVGHCRVGDVLGAARTDEVDVCDQDRNPGEETEDGGEVDEVAEDNFAVVCDIHVGKKAEECREEERVDWNSATVGLLEDGRSIAVGG